MPEQYGGATFSQGSTESSAYWERGPRGRGGGSRPKRSVWSFRGIPRTRHRQEYHEWLQKLADVSAVLLIDEETATHCAVVRERLRAKGRPIPSHDAWIAALALQHRLPISTRDEHGIERRTW